MGRTLGLLAIIVVLVIISVFWKGASALYLEGFYWAMRPQGVMFWLTAGLVGLIASHLGGERRYMLPVWAIGVGAIFALLGSRSTQLPELTQLAAPAVLLIGFLIAYSAKPENWLAIGAVALGGAVQGFLAGRAIGGRLDNLYFLGGFGVALAVYVLGGLVLGDMCNKLGNGGSIRSRIGAGAAGVGLYLTLAQYVSWV